MSKTAKIIILVVILLFIPLIINGPSRRREFDLEGTKVADQQEAFLNAVIEVFGQMDSTQEHAVKVIVEAFYLHGDWDGRKLAYMLATAYHESRLRPIKEWRGKEGTEHRERQDRYWGSGYYGRGFVQLTWDYNYRKMGKELGVDLLNNPDMALDPVIAAYAMVIGMMKGMFTGQKLRYFINEVTASYYNARRTVNGTDRADLIKGYTLEILEKL